MADKLNATAASLLGFLHERPMSGWDLVETAEASIGGFWTLTRSQVYRELAKLAVDGLVLAGVPGSRDRREYALTDAGRAAFADWLGKEPGAEQIRFPLLLTVGFGRHLPPDQLAAFVATHRRVHEERLAGYLELRVALEKSEQADDKDGGEKESAPGDPYGWATLDMGIRYERAVLDWFAALPSAISGASPEREE